MAKRFTICFIFFIFYLHAHSAMIMKCASVGASGDVTITWTNTATAIGFHAYYIYHSTTAGSGFTLIDSVLAYGSQNYDDLNASALTTNAFYYVVLTDNSGASTLSDTIQAIHLTVINTGNGYASLSWNKTRNPLIVTNSLYYKIFREFPAGIWTLVDSVDVSSKPSTYSDEITICRDTIKYRIEVSDSGGCTSVSNVDGNLFRDLIPPSTPNADSVSVDAAGNAVLGWSPNSSKDTYAYVILQKVSGTWVVIDTVFGINNTFYATGFSALGSPLQFSMYAIDSCGNPSAHQDPGQETMVLNGTFQRCTASMSLTWNPYVNSVTSPSYLVVVSKNGGSPTIAANTTSTNFTVTGLESDSSYCIKVVAVLNGGAWTASSTELCFTANLPTPPQFTYIRSVSVQASSLVEVKAYVDTLAGAGSYSLLRSDFPMGTFSVVATIPNNKNPLITFFDPNASDADNKIYYYEVSAIDSCGNKMPPSQISHTMVPKATANHNFTNMVSWNNYELWPNGVRSYAVFLIVGASSAVQVGSIPFGDSTFLDYSPIKYLSSDGKFCYRIAAYEAGGNPYGFSDTSYSGIACTSQSSSLFMPNAFDPDGFNNEFKPGEAFVSFADYSLKIFSRFGEIVFESNSPSIGWNGSYKGNLCPMDVYAWTLNAKTSTGDDIKKVGVVTLVR